MPYILMEAHHIAHPLLVHTLWPVPTKVDHVGWTLMAHLQAMLQLWQKNLLRSPFVLSLETYPSVQQVRPTTSLSL